MLMFHFGCVQLLMRLIFVLCVGIFKINLFICLFLAALGVHYCARAFFLVAASGGYSSLRCPGFSLQWLLLLRSTGSRARAQ